MRVETIVAALVLLVAACGGAAEVVDKDGEGALDVVEKDASRGVDLIFADKGPIGKDSGKLEVWEDFSGGDLGSGCAAGEGCFLDSCDENGDCQSGWCVEHMGDGVCTQSCEEECPQGWSCKSVGGAGPDVVYICVSNFANLCKPCATTEGCQGVGTEDVCVDYGTEGSFCGGGCGEDQDCPWGFSCMDTETVDGIGTQQCVADAGVCPCAVKSVALALTTPCESSNDVGSCNGQRVCLADGLSDCDAAVPEEEFCDGLDNDCNGYVDEGTCDDGNDCTEDSCAGVEGCVNEPLDGTECKDGDPCSVADHCESGVCVGAPVQCNDDNPCTEDVCTAQGGCEHPAVAGPCDDGEVCTVGDQCLAGQCAGTPVSCDCQSDADCAALEDGDLCNGTLVCDVTKFPYQCVVDAETVVVCDQPGGHDGPCLTAVCDSPTGTCDMVPANPGAPCEDGDSCTLGDTCDAGMCVAGGAANCNDGNPCTDDSCDALLGCQHSDNSAACSDGDVCTQGDQCAGGSCVAGQPLLCDDGNVCNGLESCDPVTGCTTGQMLACDDGDPCNGVESCDPVTGCKPGGGGSCDDGNPCTDDTCDGDEGCLHVANEGACSDGNLCTSGDHCSAGACVSNGTLECQDDNPCTEDSCDSLQGCVTTLSSAPCDDGDLCTIGDHCQLGACIGSGELLCNDGNICTDDSCNPNSGCQFLANSEGCNDGNACTLNDLCKGGWCSGTALLCNDGNVCTDDLCDVATGCLFEANEAACEDGDACSVNDYCQAGVCHAGTSADCDDGNPCTDDSCSGQGCVYIANKGNCDDSNACTDGDYCEDAECMAGVPVVCDDGNVCTDDSCNPALGCEAIPNVAPCDDGDLCTSDDQCAAGECIGGDALNCDDAINCTQDSCEPLTGCVHIASQCCGNGVVDAGEDCDDGGVQPGDGCNESCQYESYVYSLPFTPDDFDVAYDGRLVAVGREGTKVVAQCYRADRQPNGGKFTIFEAPAGANVETVYVGVSGGTGHWAILARHQTVAGDWASRRGMARMYNGNCEPVTAPFLMDADETLDEPRTIDMDEKGNAYFVWMGETKKMYLMILGPDGVAKKPATNFATCTHNYGLQAAVQNNGSRGVVTCQGHAGDPVRFWLFDGAGDVYKANVIVEGTPPSSWYMSHNVGMDAAGRFLVVWATSSGNARFLARTYDENGVSKGAAEVGPTAGSCFDPFRNNNAKIPSVGGEFLVPYVLAADGPCHQSNFHGLTRVDTNGEVKGTSTSAHLTHTLVLDNFKNSYVRSGSQVHLNAVSLE